MDHFQWQGTVPVSCGDSYRVERHRNSVADTFAIPSAGRVIQQQQQQRFIPPKTCL